LFAGDPRSRLIDRAMEPTIDIPDNLRFVPWSDERRPVHLEETIAHAPDPDAIRVFGYDSLIWDPSFERVEARFQLDTHRRSFCFWMDDDWSRYSGAAGPGPGRGAGQETCRWAGYRLDPKMRDRLHAVQCPFDIVNQIGGWSTAGVGNAYGSGYPIAVLYGWMEKVVG